VPHEADWFRWQHCFSRGTDSGDSGQSLSAAALYCAIRIRSERWARHEKDEHRRGGADANPPPGTPAPLRRAELGADDHAEPNFFATCGTGKEMRLEVRAVRLCA